MDNILAGSMVLKRKDYRIFASRKEATTLAKKVNRPTSTRTVCTSSFYNHGYADLLNGITRCFFEGECPENLNFGNTNHTIDATCIPQHFFIFLKSLLLNPQILIYGFVL